MTRVRTRLAAYAVCRRGEEVLLAHFVSRDGRVRHWTLPGGGVDHAEDPFHGVVREVEEETGYEVEVERLLGVDSRPRHKTWGGREAFVHHVGLYYAVRITGGELRHELSGSTDRAGWFPFAKVAELHRASLVDVGLRLELERPSTGHVAEVPVGGRVH